MTTKKFGGRPKREPEPGERVHLGFRVTPDMKARVESAASDSGRSISQEAEYRLERSFERADLLADVLSTTFGPELGGVLMMIGSAMRDVGGQAGFAGTFTLEGAQQWFDNPYAFDQAVAAANRIFEALRPEGEPKAPEHFEALTEINPALAGIAEHFGAGFANAVIEAVVGEGRTARLQKDGATIAGMLGPIAERLRKGKRQ
ncbi:hypothetical protein C1D09_025355 [Mesorhizobium intechi]|uniref:Arc-like DNA binding domain-containing protein n=1 Tax=Mesorhizobium intechi TaxID=537601 RepID=A0A8T9AMC9_9HYPH|nr:hypothetical protein [Mesorhizobium intechi]TSE03754.1 hypothetical protein C1D09_025355 [Mesorhizobium intechi]